MQQCSFSAKQIRSSLGCQNADQRVFSGTSPGRRPPLSAHRGGGALTLNDPSSATAARVGNFNRHQWGRMIVIDHALEVFQKQRLRDGELVVGKAVALHAGELPRAARRSPAWVECILQPRLFGCPAKQSTTAFTASIWKACCLNLSFIQCEMDPDFFRRASLFYFDSSFSDQKIEGAAGGYTACCISVIRSPQQVDLVP